ncbi:MAG: HD domain-containing protein [Lachnospiraceae bacterium]|nr:HD domain-containing protein [Lachnospiraceae bacterium]
MAEEKKTKDSVSRDLDMAKKIALLVHEAGGRVFYVGGFVRDLLMKRDNKDIDIEVHGITVEKLEEILNSVGYRTEMGASFGVFGLKGYDLDIAMPRKEEAIGRGHKDFKVDVDPFLGTEKAAIRRDFTLNALMQDVLTDEIVDHFGGVDDLKKGVLRHVNTETFIEDPLRVLRGAQFAARFDFAIAEETIELCKGMDLTALAPERIMGELEKALLKAEKPSVFFERMREMEQLGYWFPELEQLIGVPQPAKHHPEGDVWTHTMLVLDQAAGLRKQAKEPLYLMLAALCHDIGKAITTEEINGRLHALGHETEGLPLVKKALQRVTNENALIKYVLNMTELHMRPNQMAADGSSQKSMNHLFDRSVSPEELILLAEADYTGRAGEWDFEPNRMFFKERLEVFQEMMAQPYVMGRDLIEAGLKPDKNFSELLAYAHKLRLAGVPKEVALKQTLAYKTKNNA